MGSCIWEKAYSALCMKVGCDEISVDEFYIEMCKKDAKSLA